MDAFLISTGVVALAEMGDKTQLLALILAARFRKPLTIILGIFLATVINHALAGVLGQWLGTLISPEQLRIALGLSFIAMAIWILIPDKDQEMSDKTWRLGVLGTTFILFFLAEVGDKTQIATVALAAQFSSLVGVVAGTTLGMMIANVPCVYAGNAFAGRLPLKWIRGVASLIFVVMAVIAFWPFVESWGIHTPTR